MKSSDCKHQDWEVMSTNTFGFGQCKICNKEINIQILFNNLRIEMQSLIKLANALNKTLDNWTELKQQVNFILNNNQNLHERRFFQLNKLFQDFYIGPKS